MAQPKLKTSIIFILLVYLSVSLLQYIVTYFNRIAEKYIKKMLKQQSFCLIIKPYLKVKQFLVWLFYGFQEEKILKWPYLRLPSRSLYKRDAQYLFKKAPNFKSHALITKPKSTIIRTRIQLSDYIKKKNILLIFLPGNLTELPRHLQANLIELSSNFKKMLELETEILIISQSFSFEVNLMLKIPIKQGGLQDLNFPIIPDPWGLILNVYNAKNGAVESSKLQSYALYFLNKNHTIRHINYFDRTVKFEIPKIYQLIRKLKS